MCRQHSGDRFFGSRFADTSCHRDESCTEHEATQHRCGNEFGNSKHRPDLLVVGPEKVFELLNEFAYQRS